MIEDLKRRLISTINKSGFELEEIPFSEQQAWVYQNGVLSHKTNGFFHTCGYRDDRLERLVMYQPQGAYNGLLVRRVNNRAQVLVQARIEPGNAGVGQFGPTIQSTPANYLRLHGGKETPYLSYFMAFSPLAQPLWTSTQLDLGERYFQKTKTLSFVEVVGEVEEHPDFIWADISSMADLCRQDHIVNTDLRSMLAVFDWDAYLSDANQGLAALSVVPLPRHSSPRRPGKLVPIGSLQGYSFNDTEVPTVSSGDGSTQDSIRMYQVTSKTREVEHWAQPLFCTANKSAYELATRDNGRGKDILLVRGDEFGAATRPAFTPRRLKDQGVDQLGSTVVKVEQSEEGGRFYLSVSDYRLTHIDEAAELDDAEAWYSLAEFKAILTTSNMVNIQLRCLASLLLKELNPIACAGGNE